MGENNPRPIGRIEKKREHYLPRRFLKRFAENGRFSVAIQNADGMIKVLSNQKPDNHGYETCLYETPAFSDGGSDEYLFPNSIEDAFEKVEGKLIGDLERCEKKLVPCSDLVSSEDAASICSTVAALVSHLMARSPLFVVGSREKKDVWLKAMRDCDLADPRILADFYQRTTGETLDEPDCLDPGRVAEFASICFNLMPSGLDPHFRPYADYGFFLNDLIGRECEFLVTVESCPFVGISLPCVIGTGPDGCTPKEIYFPLSSTLAVHYSEKRAARFSVRALDSSEVAFLNTMSASMFGWDLAFCKSDETMKRLPWGNRDIVR